MRKRKRRRRRIMDAREVMRAMGKKGGRARAKSLSADERREIAIKASEAAKKARQRKAEEKAARKDGSGRGK